MDWLTNFFGRFWQKLLDWFWWFIDSLFIPLRWLFDGVLLVLDAVCYFLFDGFLTVIELFFQSIDVTALGALNLLGANSHPVFAWFIQQLCLVQGIELILIAMVIRFTLNLIPAAFTRI